MAFFEGNNMTGGYGNGPNIINSCSVNVEKGEILGLVGESGSGKSTVGNSIINLIDEPGKVSNGSIILDGIDIHADQKNIVKSLILIYFCIE